MSFAGRFAQMSNTQKGAAAAVVAVVVIAGAGTGYAMTRNDTSTTVVAGKTSPSPAVSAAPAATAAPTSTPVPGAPAPVNPLTGLAPLPVGPVIAVKIDDTGPGRPQVGIDKADIVYIEQAEGGLTRDVAIFSSQKPVVGYIRSTRASDPELLSQYGPILLAATGGGGDSLKILDASILKSYIQDRGAGLYFRVSRGASSYINVELDLSKVSAAAVTASGPQSNGLTWDADATALAAAPVANTISSKVGGTAVGFTWDASLNRYVRVITGTRQKAADGALIATPNVIVQFCQVTAHPGDVDVNGNPSQFTHTVGSGAVSIFRNGHRVDGTWTRASTTGPTTYSDASGHPIPLSPGGAWVVLATAGAGVTSS